MKKRDYIFVAHLSEDGVAQQASKSVKSLYDYISGLGYGIQKIGCLDGEDVKFNYDNLCKEIKNNQKQDRFCVALLYSDTDNQISIYELLLK